MISDAGMEIKYSVAALFCRFLENFIFIPRFFSTLHEYFLTDLSRIRRTVWRVRSGYGLHVFLAEYEYIFSDTATRL